MSVEWIVKEKQVKYLTIILRLRGRPKTDGGTMYKYRELLVNAKL